MRLFRRELACAEVVEVITDYLEGRLSARDRRRFEAHLTGCDGCDAYLEQMRQPSPPARTSRDPPTPIRLRSCGKTTTPTQPSPIPVTAASHFGASTQRNLSRIEAAAPDQTIPSTTTRQLPRSTSSPNGVYVPAIRP